MDERIPIFVDFDWLIEVMENGSFKPVRLNKGIFFFLETKDRAMEMLNFFRETKGTDREILSDHSISLDIEKALYQAEKSGLVTWREAGKWRQPEDLNRMLKTAGVDGQTDSWQDDPDSYNIATAVLKADLHRQVEVIFDEGPPGV